jgi:hypothetical protein
MPENIQFIRLTGYGEKPGRGQPSYATIKGIIAEAVRSAHNAPHVAFPREPRKIFGIDPLEVAHQATELLHRARDTMGRRLRKSCVVLIAGVATYPIPKSDMGGFVSDGDVYSSWEQETLEFLKKEHGETLKCVLRHEDETHLHIHFYILPKLNIDGHLDFHHAHPGRYARADAVERGVCTAAQDAAYTNATVEYQNRYHANVSRRFGHERTGPRRKRVDRDRHKANRSAAEHVERVRAELELDYRVTVSESEANERSSYISEVPFIAVAVEREQRLRAEIARLEADKKRLEKEIRRLRQVDDEPQIGEAFVAPDVGEPVARQYLMENLASLAQLESQPLEGTLGEGSEDEPAPSTVRGFSP